MCVCVRVCVCVCVRACVCACVCVSVCVCTCVCAHVCVCVREWERERVRERVWVWLSHLVLICPHLCQEALTHTRTHTHNIPQLSVCVCVCVCDLHVGCIVVSGPRLDERASTPPKKSWVCSEVQHIRSRTGSWTHIGLFNKISMFAFFLRERWENLFLCCHNTQIFPLRISKGWSYLKTNDFWVYWNLLIIYR